MVQLRTATPSDAKEILGIYSSYIENTSFTFETETPTTEQFAERIETYLRTWPWLVCDVDGKIAGYTYGTRYRERVAYQWCTESSIYIHDDYQKMGIGHALYKSLFEILKRQGFRNIYAVINLPNEKSVAFHEKLGFLHFATYEQVGYKLGKWKNVGWWRKIVNEFGMDPEPPVPFEKLDKGFLPILFSKMIQLIKH